MKHMFAVAAGLVLVTAAAAPASARPAPLVGELFSFSSGLCLTAPARPGPVHLASCPAGRLPARLAWQMPRPGTGPVVTAGGMCLTRTRGGTVLAVARCDRSRRQRWDYAAGGPGSIAQIITGTRCVTAGRDRPRLDRCDGADPAQDWLWVAG